jgi:hypothetical protein
MEPKNRRSQKKLFPVKGQNFSDPPSHIEPIWRRVGLPRRFGKILQPRKGNPENLFPAAPKVKLRHVFGNFSGKLFFKLFNFEQGGREKQLISELFF